MFNILLCFVMHIPHCGGGGPGFCFVLSLIKKFSLSLSLSQLQYAKHENETATEEIDVRIIRRHIFNI